MQDNCIIEDETGRIQLHTYTKLISKLIIILQIMSIGFSDMEIPQNHNTSPFLAASYLISSLVMYVYSNLDAIRSINPKIKHMCRNIYIKYSNYTI